VLKDRVTRAHSCISEDLETSLYLKICQQISVTLIVSFRSDQQLRSISVSGTVPDTQNR
jgi:hypothetical protein